MRQIKRISCILEFNYIYTSMYAVAKPSRIKVQCAVLVTCVVLLELTQFLIQISSFASLVPPMACCIDRFYAQ